MPTTATVDLTTLGKFGSVGAGIFSTGQQQPAGTGVFNSFVQIQNNGSEQGYNTDHSAQYDEKSSQNHNHSILLADVPLVEGDSTNGTAEGVLYREFLLDIAEPNGGNKSLLSLDKLQIWQEEAGNLTNFTPGTGFAGGHTNYLVYNLDAGGDHWVAMNAGLSHGNGQSDIRVLIPNSLFINDTAHRYVTLYSSFGEQGGGNASEGSFEEWGLHGNSGGAKSALALSKTATVPGGTADHAGEVISYSLVLSNTGNTAQTGVILADPSVSNLTRVADIVGNNDNVLSVGETWHYTANHTVTQDDIDSAVNGGDISNTATAKSDQTPTPVSANATVPVDWQPSVVLDKTADVTVVDAAGDLINYAITVENAGNTTLTNPDVTDSTINIVTPVLDFTAPVVSTTIPLLVPILNGDYNVGDVGTLAHPEYAQNGIQDPGETFQYANAGDANQNGIQDAGETFLFANVGDTNGNGVQDPGETFQYYNAGDTGTLAHPEFKHNGVQDPGETFQFNVSHAPPPVEGVDPGFNIGDTNQDSRLSVGETWQYAFTYTVTQADIDNRSSGGTPTVDSHLTHDNVATVDTDQGVTSGDAVSVQVAQRPDVTLVKTASVPGGSANIAGEVISYTIDVTNIGNMTLTSPVVSDPSVSHLLPVLSAGFNTGDTNQDNELDLGETWHYTADHTVTQDDIDHRVAGVPTVTPGLNYANTASVGTAQNASDTDTASVPIAQNPAVTLVKAATVPGNTADTVGEVISYTIDVTNTGNMTLTTPVVSDPSVSDLNPILSAGFNTGDINHDNELDVGETWHYTADHTVTQADIDHRDSEGVPTVSNTLTYDNLASVGTAQGANGSDSASVPVAQNPHVTLVKTASPDTVHTAGDVINYTIDVGNNGNMTLTGVNVTDPAVSNLAAVLAAGFNTGDTNHNGELNVGETWHYTANHTVTQAEIDTGGPLNNTASVTTAQGATATNGASVPVVHPDLTIAKAADAASVDAAGEVINYTVTVDNAGNVVLTGVAVTDPFVTLTYATGDTNGDNKLDLDETWTYTGSHTVTQAEIDAGTNIQNTATVDTDQTDPKTASASVAVVPPAEAPVMSLDISDNLGSHWVDSNENGVGDNVAGSGHDLVQFALSLHNLSNDTLTITSISDLLGDAVPGNYQNEPPATLAPAGSPGDTWGSTYNHFLTASDVAGHHALDQLTVTVVDSQNHAHTITAEWNQVFP